MDSGEGNSGCPVDHGNSVPVDMNIAKSINDLPSGQQKQPYQKVDLSTRRAVSHIDKVIYVPHLLFLLFISTPAQSLLQTYVPPFYPILLNVFCRQTLLPTTKCKAWTAGCTPLSNSTTMPWRYVHPLFEWDHNYHCCPPKKNSLLYLVLHNLCLSRSPPTAQRLQPRYPRRPRDSSHS